MTIQTDTDLPDEAFNPLQQFDEVAGDIRDPYPILHAMREAGAIQDLHLGREMGEKLDPKAPKMPKMYTVFSYDLVHQVLTDPETFSSRGYEIFMGPVLGHTILEMDAPEHPRHRALVAKAFRTRMLERWSDTLIYHTVNELLDEIAHLGKADLVQALTFRFPVKVIARILGLPESDLPKFNKWSLELISVSQDWDRALAASQTLASYFRGIIQQRRQDPQDDLISQLVTAEVEGHTLSDEDIFPFLRLLLPAGAETTYRSSGNLLFGLLSNPEVLDAVRSDRSLVPQAIDEALRWEPPLLFITRIATRDVEVGGVEVTKDAILGLSLGAANRDPARYVNPDAFDIYREQRQHISFGSGPHLCLGQHLAKLETRALLETVFDRLPNLRLDPDGDDPHIHGMTFRSPTSLPVLFDPA
jgi:cytochrome P450